MSIHAAAALLDRCRAHGIRIAVAESCTGGVVAAAMTAIAGASDVFDRGFVTYSNEAKTDMLGVPAELIAWHGAVSAPVAESMARGAISHSRAKLSVAVTGIAGPSGGSAQKPVGTVYVAVALHDWVRVEKYALDGDRAAIRAAAMHKALEMMIEALEGNAVTALA